MSGMYGISSDRRSDLGNPVGVHRQCLHTIPGCVRQASRAWALLGYPFGVQMTGQVTS